MDVLRALLREIHRRTLWQVLGIYLVASWAVLQVVDTLGGALRLPDWTEPFALVLLIVGLPIVLATAFVQEGPPGTASDASAEPESGSLAALLTWRHAITGGVLAFALWGVVAAGWMIAGGRAGPAARGDGAVEASVAVMPCEDLSPTADQEALAQGVSEEVSYALSQLPDLRVSGRASVRSLQDQSADLRTIASTLGVANVFQCSLVRDGDRVRVNAQLTDVLTGSVLWSERFDQEFRELFEVLDVIARAVTSRLEVVFGGEDPLVARQTRVPEAHEAYLRGRYLLEQRTPETLRSAIAAFERATELDPAYAQGWAGLADGLVLAAGLGWAPDRQDALSRGLEASDRAAGLAPDLAMAYPSKGFGLWVRGEWEGSAAASERAIELNPRYPLAHQWYGLLFTAIGRPDEAVAAARRAVELDPFYRQAHRNLVWALLAADRTDEAADVAQSVVELVPDWSLGWGSLASARQRQGRLDEMAQAMMEEVRLNGADPEDGRRAIEAIRQYQESGEPVVMSAPPGWGGGALAFYALTGQFDRAVRAAEADVEAGLTGILMLIHHTLPPEASRRLADDPRYRLLLEGAGVLR